MNVFSKAFAMGLLIWLTACSGHQPPETPTPPDSVPVQSTLVGTWQLVSMKEASTGTVYPMSKRPTFIRFYETGIAASWPVPAAERAYFKVDEKGVSRSPYQASEDRLVIGSDNPQAPGAKYRMDADHLVIVNAIGDEVTYRRIVPDVEPGK